MTTEKKCPTCDRVEGKPIMMYLPDGLKYEIQEFIGDRRKKGWANDESCWKADTRFYTRYDNIVSAVQDIKHQIPKKDWSRYRIVEIHTIRRECAHFYQAGWMIK